VRADVLVQQLDHVRSRGEGKWVACCPAHDDSSPSLTISEGRDGRVLVHCFAGCGSSDVVEALGLKLSDLYNEPLEHHRKGFKRKADPTIDELTLEIGDGWRKNGRKQTSEHKEEERAAWLRQQRVG